MKTNPETISFYHCIFIIGAWREKNWKNKKKEHMKKRLISFFSFGSKTSNQTTKRTQPRASDGQKREKITLILKERMNHFHQELYEPL